MPMEIIFNSSKRNTVGVELELQIIDTETRALTSGSVEMIQKAGDSKHIKQELFQSIIEINTDVCHNITELREELNSRVCKVIKLANSLGFDLASMGTHPFSSWREQIIYPNERYQHLIEDIQYLGRRMLTFGMHVHVGVENPEKAIFVTNALINYLPIIFSLSTSGPFWYGSDSGLASVRPKIFETLPNAGMPPYHASWNDYTSTIGVLLKAGSIKSLKELWWDVRPHPDYGTVEVRTCDSVPTIDEAVAITAFIQTLVAWLSDKYDNNEQVILLPTLILRENRWRSIRNGLNASLINRQGDKKPLKTILSTLLEELAETASQVDAYNELIKIETILNNGTSSDRQRALYHKTNSLPAVVNSLVEELKSNTLCQV